MFQAYPQEPTWSHSRRSISFSFFRKSTEALIFIKNLVLRTLLRAL